MGGEGSCGGGRKVGGKKDSWPILLVVSSGWQSRYSMPARVVMLVTVVTPTICRVVATPLTLPPEPVR